MNLHGIPQIDYTTNGEDNLEVENKCAGKYSNLEEFYKLFSELIGSDCWALKVNDEIIFNHYDKNRPLRERLCDNVIRENLIANPQNLFVKLFRSKTWNNAIVCIYFHGSDSVVYHITVKRTSFQDEYEFIVKAHSTLKK